jgi:hypothetical protein
MPNRLPWIVDETIQKQTIGRLIEERAVFILQCHGCWHEAIWGAVELHDRFPGKRHVVFDRVAPHLRCSKCHSEWLQVVRLHGRRAEEHNARQPLKGGRPS